MILWPRIAFSLMILFVMTMSVIDWEQDCFVYTVGIVCSVLLLVSVWGEYLKKRYPEG